MKHEAVSYSCNVCKRPCEPNMPGAEKIWRRDTGDGKWEEIHMTLVMLEGTHSYSSTEEFDLCSICRSRLLSRVLKPLEECDLEESGDPFAPPDDV